MESVVEAPVVPVLLVEPVALSEPELLAEPLTPPEYVDPGLVLLALLEGVVEDALLP